MFTRSSANPSTNLVSLVFILIFISAFIKIPNNNGALIYPCGNPLVYLNSYFSFQNAILLTSVQAEGLPRQFYLPKEPPFLEQKNFYNSLNIDIYEKIYV